MEINAEPSARQLTARRLSRFLHNTFTVLKYVCYLNSTLLIFPDMVFGSSAANSTILGYLYGAV